MDQEQHLRCAVDLVKAMGRSMSTEKVRRLEWWSRQKSALETAATSADSFGSLVSMMADKLQIDVTTVATAQKLAELAKRVDDPPEFIRYCERQSIYIIAIAQAESQDRRAAREQTHGDIVDHYGSPNLQPEE